MGASIGLGSLRRGAAREGEIIIAAKLLENKPNRLRGVSLHFEAPDGRRKIEKGAGPLSVECIVGLNRRNRLRFRVILE